MKVLSAWGYTLLNKFSDPPSTKPGVQFFQFESWVSERKNCHVVLGLQWCLPDIHPYMRTHTCTHALTHTQRQTQIEPMRYNTEALRGPSIRCSGEQMLLPYTLKPNFLDLPDTSNRNWTARSSRRRCPIPVRQQVQVSYK